MSFDIRHLRHFLRATETRSISRAAEDLCVTQPALSYSIRNLELSLGTRLFNRLPGGLELTETGVRFEIHARSILRAVEQARTDLMQLDSDPAGPVHLGITIGLAELLTIPTLELVRRKYPRLFLSITESPSGQLVEKLKIGEIDIALTFIAEAETLLKTERVANDQYFLCGRKDKIDAIGAQSIPAADLGKFPLVMMSQQNGQRTLVEAAAAKMAGSLDIVAEIDTTAGLKRAMLAGLAFSMFPLPSLFPEYQQGLIGALPVVEPEIRRPLFISMLPHSGQIGGVRAVGGVVRELVSKFKASKKWSPDLLSISTTKVD